MPQIDLSEQLRLNEGLRDFVVAQVRDAPIRSKRKREVLAAIIERYWHAVPKEEKRLARGRQAFQIEWELAGMIDAGTPVAEAKKKLAHKYRHNSAQAFDKWLRRHRGAWQPVMY